MMRILLALALVCASVLPVRAQGTTMPHPLIQWFDNAGGVFSAGGLCVFVAGTSTLATTYTTAALSVANANPIEFDSAGRPTSGGVFLTPGSSYKFVLKDFAGVVSPTCIPDTGVTIWTVDNIQAVPRSAAAVDLTATAGESIAAGEAAYVSTGAGGLNAGQLYKTDADLIYKSTGAIIVGVAPNAITSGNSGTVRISGSVTVTGPLSTGSAYYASATAGGLTTTPPTNAIRIGMADAATSIVVGNIEAPVSPRGPPCGRLTLTSGTPVTSSDVTAATTVYYTPAGSCNTIYLFDGTSWDQYPFVEISIAVPATANTLYDVFAYDNAGAVALELTAWTNDTTRATALAFQNGVYVRSGGTTRRYLGTFRTTGVNGQTEDSAAKRYLWNYYNRALRSLRVIETTNTWDYSLPTIRQANGAATNQVDVVVGVQEVTMHLTLSVFAINDTTTNTVRAGFGEDSTTTFMSTVIGGSGQIPVAFAAVVLCILDHMPAVGRHFYSWNEAATASGVTSWHSNLTGAFQVDNAGISGWIEG